MGTPLNSIAYQTFNQSS